MSQRYLRQVTVATHLLAPTPTGAGDVGAGAVGSAGTVAAAGAALGLQCRVGHLGLRSVRVVRLCTSWPSSLLTYRRANHYTPSTAQPIVSLADVESILPAVPLRRPSVGITCLSCLADPPG
jgi:hypothetical protein